MGICGGFDPLYEDRYHLGRDYVHDGASVLSRWRGRRGRIEEERSTGQALEQELPA